MSKARILTISFTERDSYSLIPHEEDTMMINLQIPNWNVKRVLINHENSANII